MNSNRLRKSVGLVVLTLVVGLGLGWALGSILPGSVTKDRSNKQQLTEPLSWRDTSKETERQSFVGGDGEDDATIRVVKEVGPAVVKITTTEQQVIDSLMGRFVQETEGIGSGVIIDDAGHILTNSHVVENAAEIFVWLSGRNDPYVGKLVGADPYTDLAVVKIDGKDLPTATLGDSSTLQVGQTVIAIGNPYGFENSVTRGLVSALGRGLMIDPNTNLQLEGVIQTDASINPGNSGGPLLNLAGQVVGINTAIIAEAQGIGFAIPINLAKEVAAEIIRYGRVVRLGVLGGTLTASFVRTYEQRLGERLPVDTGVFVTEVIKDSPASQAGIKAGDIITHIDGQTINSIEELVEKVKKAGYGAKLSVTMYRRGESRSRRITVVLQ